MLTPFGRIMLMMSSNDTSVRQCVINIFMLFDLILPKIVRTSSTSFFQMASVRHQVMTHWRRWKWARYLFNRWNYSDCHLQYRRHDHLPCYHYRRRHLHHRRRAVTTSSFPLSLTPLAESRSVSSSITSPHPSITSSSPPQSTLRD